MLCLGRAFLPWDPMAEGRKKGGWRERESLIYPSVRNPLPQYDKVTLKVMALPSLCSNSQRSHFSAQLHWAFHSQTRNLQKRPTPIPKAKLSWYIVHSLHRSLRDNQIKIYLIQTSSSLSHQKVVPAGETQTAVLSQGGVSVL